jgi:hypothetical protein
VRVLNLTDSPVKDLEVYEIPEGTGIDVDRIPVFATIRLTRNIRRINTAAFQAGGATFQRVLPAKNRLLGKISCPRYPKACPGR